MYYTSVVGELRDVFDIMVGQVAKTYGVDIEDDLAQIIFE